MGEHNDRPDEPATPWVVIPYYPGDMGRPGTERPLGAVHPSWLCPAINVAGGPFFMPGSGLSLTVDVANYGGGSTIDLVNVIVWWSDPTTGFTMKTYLGQNAVYVPRSGGTGTTQSVGGVIPASAPSHICLLAFAYAPGDTPKAGVIDPVNDRHWAQLNLTAVAANKQGNFSFTFWAANPMKWPAAFELVIQPVATDALPALERLLRARPEHSDDLRVSMRMVSISALRGSHADDGRTDARHFDLKAGTRRPIHVTGRLGTPPHPGGFVALEVLQRVLGARDERTAVVGSLGVAVMAAPD
jgi:hypothetical protein